MTLKVMLSDIHLTQWGWYVNITNNVSFWEQINWDPFKNWVAFLKQDNSLSQTQVSQKPSPDSCFVRSGFPGPVWTSYPGRFRHYATGRAIWWHPDLSWPLTNPWSGRLSGLWPQPHSSPTEPRLPHQNALTPCLTSPLPHWLLAVWDGLWQCGMASLNSSHPDQHTSAMPPQGPYSLTRNSSQEEFFLFPGTLAPFPSGGTAWVAALPEGPEDALLTFLPWPWWALQAGRMAFVHLANWCYAAT